MPGMSDTSSIQQREVGDAGEIADEGTRAFTGVITAAIITAITTAITTANTHAAAVGVDVLPQQGHFLHALVTARPATSTSTSSNGREHFFAACVGHDAIRCSIWSSLP